MKLYRLLAMVMYMLNRDKVTAKELADRFEVSVRTVYRDLETIGQAGIPIVAYQGTHGGYGILDTYIIDRQVLTDDEITSIVAALQGVSQTITDNKFSNIAEKIETLTHSNRKSTAQSTPEKFYLDITPWGLSGEHQSKFQQIENSIDSSLLLQFSYTNLNGHSTQRVIEPMTLVLRSTSWYVYGFCRLRQDYRLFKIHRMQNVVQLDETFVRRDLEYKDNLLHRQWQQNSEEVDLVLRFHLDAMTKAQEYFSQNQITNLDDSHFIVNVTYPADEWVYSFILGFGGLVEVLEPQHVRNEVEKRAEAICRHYRSFDA